MSYDRKKIMSYTVINIEDNTKIITATAEKEIFKFSSKSNIEELIGFNPTEDKIYLPESAKAENPEITLEDFGVTASVDWSSPYEGSNYTGTNLSSSADLLISKTKHPNAKDNPTSEDFFNEAEKNYKEASKALLTGKYIGKVFATFSSNQTAASRGSDREQMLTKRYAKSQELFGDSEDIAFYLGYLQNEDTLYLIQGHPNDIPKFKYQEKNREDLKEFIDFLKNSAPLKKAATTYKPNNLGKIRTNGSGSLKDLAQSIYFHDGSPAWLNKQTAAETQRDFIQKPEILNKRTADKITNFNPSADTLEIDTESFSIDSSATFAAGASKKEVKKVLAKQDVDFLYDQKKGGLYFNENGAEKGFGDGGIIAILKGAPDLTIDNLEFI